MVRIYEAKLIHKCSKQVWAPLQLKGGTFIMTNFCVSKVGKKCYTLKRNDIIATIPKEFIRESKPSKEEAQKIVDDYMGLNNSACLKL